MASIKWLAPRKPFFPNVNLRAIHTELKRQTMEIRQCSPRQNGTRCICNKYDGLPRWTWILSLKKALCNILSRLSTPPTNCTPVDGIFAPCPLKCNLFSNYDVTNEVARKGKNSSEIWKYKLRYVYKNESKMLNKFFSRNFIFEK